MGKKSKKQSKEEKSIRKSKSPKKNKEIVEDKEDLEHKKEQANNIPTPTITNDNNEDAKDVEKGSNEDEEIEEDTEEKKTADAEKEKESKRKRDSETSEEADVSNSRDPDFFSKEAFASLPLSSTTFKALNELKFTHLTQIQSKCIAPLLSGKDLIGSAKTGSGKTLAFSIPVIEILHKTKFTTKNGTGAIIISPTRELSLQTYGVIDDIISSGGHNQTYGLIMGGANRSSEASRLAKGVNILIATPGRLLDHLNNTKPFVFRNLQILVIDEADRLLDQGFEEDLRSILKILPKQRQTILFSATNTDKIDDLAKLSIKQDALYVAIKTTSGQATNAGLKQGYVTCPPEKRFLLLFSFLKRFKQNKKIMVFFSSCNSVKYHSDLLNYIDIPCVDIHGKQKQNKRTSTFFQFVKADSQILLCTDVAARGLDIPKVDWIIQYDPPDDPKEYIHRVGRTARGATGAGKALLFLLPEETTFLTYLAKSNVSLTEYDFPTSKLSNIQSSLFKLIDTNYYLHKSARDAFRSYLLSYASHSLKDIFNVNSIDLQKMGNAFGFTTPPRVNLSIFASVTSGETRNRQYQKGNKKQKIERDSGHAFSASNPYGKREKGDKRQFSF